MTRMNTLKTIPLLNAIFESKERISSIMADKPEQQDCNNVYQKILADLRESVDYKWATIFLLETTAGQLKRVAQQGEEIDFINRISFSLGTGLSAWVAQKKRVVHLPDIHRGTRHEHHPVRSFVSLPLMKNDHVVGVLNLAHIYPNAFGCKELQILQDMSDEIVNQIRQNLPL